MMMSSKFNFRKPLVKKKRSHSGGITTFTRWRWPPQLSLDTPGSYPLAFTWLCGPRQKTSAEVWSRFDYVGFFSQLQWNTGITLDPWRCPCVSVVPKATYVVEGPWKASCHLNTFKGQRMEETKDNSVLPNEGSLIYVYTCYFETIYRDPASEDHFN